LHRFRWATKLSVHNTYVFEAVMYIRPLYLSCFGYLAAAP